MINPKCIVYTIVSKQVFEVDENSEIQTTLDDLRGRGVAEISDVEIVEGDINTVTEKLSLDKFYVAYYD